MVAAVNPHRLLPGGRRRRVRARIEKRTCQTTLLVCSSVTKIAIKEIAEVLARYGFARLADHAAAAADTGLRATLVARIADPDLAALTSGQRLRGALSELGTTWIKFGQMLSLHPDLVGNEVAAEPAQLQSNVPPTHPVPPSRPSRPNSA